MANSANWVGYAVLDHLVDLLKDLRDDGTVDDVTADPTAVEWSGSRRFLYVRIGGIEWKFVGMSGTYSDVSVSVLIRAYTSQTSTDGVQLSLQRLLATIVDKIQDNLSGFHDLDPPCQVDEGISTVDDPAFSTELDLSAATLEVRVRNHGRS